MTLKQVFIGLVLTLTVLPAHAATLFVKGSKGVGVTLGNGSIQYGRHTENYIILGVNASYYLIDNLELGLGYRGWFDGEPTQHQVTVPLTYYIPVHHKIKPYVGTFARRTFVSDSKLLDDYNSYGFRVGAAVVTSRNSYMGVGWVQEYYDDCEQWKECSTGNLEVTFGVGF